MTPPPRHYPVLPPGAPSPDVLSPDVLPSDALPPGAGSSHPAQDSFFVRHRLGIIIGVVVFVIVLVVLYVYLTRSRGKAPPDSDAALAPPGPPGPQLPPPPDRRPLAAAAAPRSGALPPGMSADDIKNLRASIKAATGGHAGGKPAGASASKPSGAPTGASAGASTGKSAGAPAGASTGAPAEPTKSKARGGDPIDAQLISNLDDEAEEGAGYSTD